MDWIKHSYFAEKYDDRTYYNFTFRYYQPSKIFKEIELQIVIPWELIKDEWEWLNEY